MLLPPQPARKLEPQGFLPALCPDLSYGHLDGVQDRGMAVAAFMEAIDPGTTPEHKAKIEGQLIEYCKLDTLAMVRIWQVFSLKNHFSEI